MSPQPATLAEIQRLAQSFSGGFICFAGSPQAKSPPLGVQEILRMSGQTSVRQALGLTRTKSAAAFTPPSIQTRTFVERAGTRVHHFAALEPTASEDATHESYYPAAGLHEKPGQSGRRAREFWEVTQELSDMIRDGEQEHLNDARHAYEITYKCIENTINQLAGHRFGPAPTPHAASEMAVAELQRRLPVQLGINPADWVTTLDRLLLLTRERDTNLWHAIESDSIREEDGKVIERLRPSTFFQVKKVGSHELVRL